MRSYLADETPHQRVKAVPGQGTHVPIWLLGSSGYSAQLAAKLGLPFAFAAQFAPGIYLRLCVYTAIISVPQNIWISPMPWWACQ
ncbi:hypothetical protein HSBAA_13970 [Vreelandella sulfidaeris]|uniref:Luciferase-like domain-containing protein n=1 Tax=Vreelandella sulfidaeris TaxID=115553 RepID=A0A455U6J3_9GAMM|nr:hypothetical protein HSBAA_13970 [Halomonas sulfidaeris]